MTVALLVLIGKCRPPLQFFKMPERLRRLEEVFTRSPIYFVTACAFGRRPVLATAVIHDALRRFGEVGESCGAWLGAYIIMPDHIHLFVALDVEQLKLGTWMKSLKNVLSRTLRAEGVPAPHWQKGFFDHVLRSGDTYSEKWFYVRDNAVRAGLVREWKDWPYVGEVFDLELTSQK